MQLIVIVLCFFFGDVSIQAFAGFGGSRPQLRTRTAGSVIKRQRSPLVTKELPPTTADVDVAKVSAVERLQKVIAHSGVASRRTAEEMIQDGRVSVNGKLITELGKKVNSRIDTILVDGKKVTLPDVKSTFWVAVNKPKAMLTTLRDEKDRSTILSIVPKAHELHLMPVGGLDRDHTGLMVLTNDIGWIHHMTHPAYPHNNRYEVLLEGLPEEEQLDILRDGVLLPGDSQRCTPCTVNVVDYDRKSHMSMLNILVDERRAMQLERMLEHVGCKIITMKRLEFCGLGLKRLRKGAWRELTASEIISLKANCNPAAGLKMGYAAAAARDAIPAHVDGVTPASGSKARVSRVDVQDRVQETHSSSTESPTKRAPHRLKPRYRDESPSLVDEELLSYERLEKAAPRRDERAMPAVHTKGAATYNSARKNTYKRGDSRKNFAARNDDDRRAPGEAREGRPVDRTAALAEYAPQEYRRNAYDRSFQPRPEKTSAAPARRVAPVRRGGGRSIDPKRPVYGAEPWLSSRSRSDRSAGSTERATSSDREGSGSTKPNQRAKSNKHSKFNRK